MGTVKYSGPVASFHCPTEATIRSLKVHFSPKQLGEGTPSPDNVREIEGWEGVTVQQSGINLFNPNTEWFVQGGRYYSRFVNNDTALFRMDLIEKNTTADVSGCFIGFALDPSNIELGYCWALRNGTVRPAANRTNRSGAHLPLQYLSIYPSTIETLTKILARYDVRIVLNDVPETAPFKPYQGFSTTNYEFGVLGKNKFNAYDWQTDESCIEIQDSSSLTVNTIPYIERHNSYDISSTKGIQRTLSFKTKTVSLTDSRASVSLGAFKDNGENVVSQITIKLTEVNYETEYVLSIPPECDTLYFRNWAYNGFLTLSDIQLEFGSTATTYEPYDPNRTVYGGWVDLVSGEVCETYRCITLTGDETIRVNSWRTGVFDIQWYNTASNNKYRFVDGTVNNTFCNMLVSKKANYFLETEGAICARGGDGETQFTYLIWKDTETFGTTTEECKAKLKELYDNNTPLMVYVEKQPRDYITYHLAPTSMQTFLGHNNVWSNADYVEVEYDLHETQNILARKQFIIANQPHIEKLAAAPLQNFNTDMAAPVKECKVYFNPVQEGSGDPSPSNVRPITGWTGLTAYHSGENLYVPNENNKGYIKNDGTIVVDDHSTYTNLIPVVAGNIYSFKCTTVSINGSTNRRLHGYDSSGNWVSQLKVATTAENIVENVNIMVTIPSGISYIRVSFRLGDANPRVAKENVYEANWNDSGTIYGGYIDLIKGELVQTHMMQSLAYGSASNWSVADASQGMFLTDMFTIEGMYKDRANPANCFCDKFKVVSRDALVNNYIEGDYCIGFFINSSGNKLTLIKSSNFINWTTQQLYDFLTSNQPHISGRLPENRWTTYQLTPTQLKTLRGTNNIWSDANGDITIQFWRH